MGQTHTIVMAPSPSSQAEKANLEAMRTEEEQLLDDLKREMEENARALDALRPKLAEQESLEQELAALREERWKMQTLRELDDATQLLEAASASKTASANRESVDPDELLDRISNVCAGQESAEAAMREMEELERELDDEMERMATQLSTAKENEKTFRAAKDALLDEIGQLHDWATGGGAEEKNHEDKD